VTVVAEVITRLRRMVAEPTTTTYADAVLSSAIERYPVMDEDGYEPDEDDWTATYDLNAAAAEIWTEKAATLVAGYDFQAGGATYNRSQAYQQAMAQARHYMSRRQVRPIRLTIRADEDDVDDE